MIKVFNSYGTEIDFEVAAILMDDEIREQLAEDGIERTEQEFFTAYAAEHEKRYNAEWELDKKCPQY